MKYLAALIVSLCAATSFGQISSTITTSKVAIRVAPPTLNVSRKPSSIAPLDASLAFSVNVPQTMVIFPADSLDHAISGTITNLTDSTIYLQFHRYQNMPPNSWYSSVCFGSACLVYTADSAVKPFAFTPHQSQTLYLHFNDSTANNEGNRDTLQVTLVIQQEPGLPTDTVVLHLAHILDPTASVSSHLEPSNDVASILSVYPNPSIGEYQMSAQIYSPQGGVAVVALYNNAGQKLRELTLSQRLQPGTNILRFDPVGLASGAYSLVVNINADPPLIKRFMISK